MLQNKFFITAKTTEENARRWLNIIRFGESGTVIQIQDDCEYRILEIITNPYSIKTVLDGNDRSYILKYIPLDQKDLLQTIKDTLIQICVEEKIGPLQKLIVCSNSQLLQLLSKKDKHVGLFISHVTPILNSGNLQPLFDLELLVQTSNNLSIVVFSELDITAEKYDILVDKASFLFDHIIKYPLYSDDDARQFIANNNSRWNLSLSEQTISKIIHACGGYLWLIHQAQRNIRDNPSFSVNEAVSDELMIRKLTAIWSKFTPEEKSILRKITLEMLEEPDTLIHEYEYLKRIRVIKELNGKVILGIPILSYVIEREHRLNKFQLKKNRLYRGDKEISDKLSREEKKLLVRMLSSKHMLVSRNEVAAAIWGNDWEEKYSDWALDRLVYRVRKKITSLGAESTVLKTIKKKGFIFG